LQACIPSKQRESHAISFGMFFAPETALDSG
jgi:hypothetical protein